MDDVTARKPLPSAMRIGMVGIHGPEAAATLQVLLEAGATITAWSRNRDSSWAKRLSRRGVTIHALSRKAARASAAVQVPALDWLVIFPGNRLGAKPPNLGLVPTSYWPRLPGRVVQLVPAGSPRGCLRSGTDLPVIALPTALVLERWLNAPMRKAIRRGLLPFPQHRDDAFPLIATHEIAEVIESLCSAKLCIEQAVSALSGQWIPLPLVLAACRSQVNRPIRHRHRSPAVIDFRMGREMGLMARWAIESRQKTPHPDGDLEVSFQATTLDGLRRLPW
ncbi:MAG: hypothetical protein SVO96_10670 [Pseudomonadota bacterium]|nr:hypothetical protein [Pseudomonadota bacterium]